MTRDPPHPRCASDCPTCAEPMPDPAVMPVAAAQAAQRIYEAQREAHRVLHPIIEVKGETPADLKARLAFEREVEWRAEHPGQAYPF